MIESGSNHIKKPVTKWEVYKNFYCTKWALCQHLRNLYQLAVDSSLKKMFFCCCSYQNNGLKAVFITPKILFISISSLATFWQREIARTFPNKNSKTKMFYVHYYVLDTSYLYPDREQVLWHCLVVQVSSESDVRRSSVGLQAERTLFVRLLRAPHHQDKHWRLLIRVWPEQREREREFQIPIIRTAGINKLKPNFSTVDSLKASINFKLGYSKRGILSSVM